MSHFRQIYGEPTPESLQKAIDNLFRAVVKAGGAVGAESVMPIHIDPPPPNDDPTSEDHPWKGIVTGDTTVKALGGPVLWPKGKSTPIADDHLSVADSGDLTVTGAGAVWLKLNAQVEQHSTSSASSSSGGTYVLTNYRIDSLAYEAFEFHTDASPPTAGTNDTDEFTVSTVDLYFKLFSCGLDGLGKAEITEQIRRVEIEVYEINDSELTKV